MSEDQQKRLFIISPIGSEGSEKWMRFNGVQRNLIAHVCEPLGYECIRADQLNRPGTITSQIVDCLIDYELVVADLSTLNPNVFYELAIRHAVDKPVILIAEKGTDLPFDVKPERVIFYSLNYEDMVKAQETLREFVESVESGEYKIETPVKSKITIERTNVVKDSELLEKMDYLIEKLDRNTDSSGSIMKMGGRPQFSAPRRVIIPVENPKLQIPYEELRRRLANLDNNKRYSYGDLVMLFSDYDPLLVQEAMARLGIGGLVSLQNDGLYVIRLPEKT